MELRYRTLNVFTTGGARLSGNPLCVVEDGSGLDGTQMQALARQFNLSETTFILPSKRAAALVRIFTPAYEMPFAGHPTLGTAHVCRALGLGGDQLGLEMRAGIIPVTASGDHWTLRAQPGSTRLLDVHAGELAKLLGLESGDIGFQPLWVKAGREQLVVPLTSEAAVRRLKPRPELFERIKSTDGAGQIYLFASTGDKKILSRSSSRMGRRFSKIRRPARPAPISAPGSSPWAADRRWRSRSVKANSSVAHRRCSSK